MVMTLRLARLTALTCKWPVSAVMIDGRPLHKFCAKKVAQPYGLLFAGALAAILFAQAVRACNAKPRFVHYASRNVPQDVGCMRDTSSREIQCPAAGPGLCGLKGHDPALDQPPVSIKAYIGADFKHVESCSDYGISSTSGDLDLYEIEVDPPVCETTIVKSVFPADEQCRKGEAGPPTAPRDGDFHGCYGAGAGGISYTNGKFQNGEYAYVPAMENSRPGDRVILCLVSFVANCPASDGRGTTYTAFNLRTHGRWRKPNSSHSCGGA